VADRPNHAVRDGDYPIVYVATDKYVCKYFPHAKQSFIMLKLAPGEQGRMVGYGALFNGAGPIKGVYLIPTFDDAPSGVWMHTEASGWTFKGGLASAQYTHVIANPRFPDQWIVWNQTFAPITGVYYTLDSGATWNVLNISSPVEGAWEAITGAWFEFSLDGSEVLCNATLQYPAGGGLNYGRVTILRGTLVDGIVDVGTTLYYQGIRGMDTSPPLPGDAGDIGFFHGISYSAGLREAAYGYYDAANTLHEIGRVPGSFAPVSDRDPQRVVAVGSGAYYALFLDQIIYSDDYRTAPAKAITASEIGYRALALTADFTIFVARLSSGVLRGSAASGSVSLTPDTGVPDTERIIALRADRQTRRIVIARPFRAAYSYVYDGSAWTLLPAPDTAVSLGQGGEAIAMPEDLE